jgi:hypothetical protein
MMGKIQQDRLVNEDQRQVLATVNRLLDTVARQDRDGMRAILLAEGLATQSRDHVVTRTPLREFPDKMPIGSDRVAESFYDPLIRVDDDIAMVWARYDFFVNGEVHHWGTNILSFLKHDGAWRVSGIADNGRTGGRPATWGDRSQ